ncbi:hypothetical protein ACFOUP_09140 [Belliella kenyensis]|uniref:Type IX secretion system membrane protein, PorP/SprF family n=1 Tax=Belliella kenyensis TaxID=1472724 RepID=A0ABV8ENH3_9BACT|nr:hypothetical protein [Belliella kenyensis]MCH7403228.1 hypothetical protein [Belliella kenyensis]MDN3604839.1 hypothetical protein [Belliella kenyensis]
MKSKILSILFFFLLSQSHGQEDYFGIDTKAKKGRMSDSNLGNTFRKAISNFSFELSSGGNYLMNSMDFNTNHPDDFPITQVRNTDVRRDITMNDTINFSGSGFNVPINVGVKLNLFDIFVVGGGYGREMGQQSVMIGSDYDFSFDQLGYTYDKVFGTFGLVLYDAKRRISFLKWKYKKYATQNTYMQSEKNQRMRQNYPWRFVLEGEYGQLYPRTLPDQRLVVNNEPYYGVALRIEREFSEYARFFVKGGAEFRSASYSGLIIEEFQPIKQQLFGLQVGMSISMPGTKRCKVQGCGVVMKHLHDGVEYRGSSIWNLQNRKVGQWY